MIKKAAFGFLLFLCAAGTAFAQNRMCSEREFAATVDETAAALRNLNSDSEKRFQQKLEAIGRDRGWNARERNEQAASVMNDAGLESFNDEIETLVTKVGALSAAAGQSVPCERLSELRQARDRLLTVMGQKSGYMLSELERNGRQASPPQTKTASRNSAPAGERGDAAPPAKPDFTAAVEEEKKPAALKPPAEAKSAAKQPTAFEQRMKETLQKSPEATSSWSANVARSERPGQQADNAAGRDSLPPQSLRPSAKQTEDAGRRRDYAALPAPQGTPGDAPRPAELGYTMQEIRDAGEGVFGTVSAELAGVINYAFQRYGRPNAYIIGEEGGGAFLAGLRYGKGQIHAKLSGQDIEPSEIYWQGPSLGFDFGATGSRSLLLVYNLKDPGAIFSRFTGVDGSAYVVGGVGLTVLSANDLVIVPIRAGVGLRVGANIGYMKFSQRSTWNPF